MFVVAVVECEIHGFLRSRWKCFCFCVFVFFNNVLCLLVLGFGGAKVGLC